MKSEGLQKVESLLAKGGDLSSMNGNGTVTVSMPDGKRLIVDEEGNTNEE